MHQLLYIFFLLLFGSDLMAQVYKWVDETGEVHYSQRPPNNVKAAEIKTSKKHDPSEAQARLKKQQQQFNALERTRKNKKKELQILAEAKKISKENCGKAQVAMQHYQSVPRILEPNSNGDIARLTEPQRQSKIQEMQDAIDDYCE